MAQKLTLLINGRPTLASMPKRCGLCQELFALWCTIIFPTNFWCCFYFRLFLQHQSNSCHKSHSISKSLKKYQWNLKQLPQLTHKQANYHIVANHQKLNDWHQHNRHHHQQLPQHSRPQLHCHPRQEHYHHLILQTLKLREEQISQQYCFSFFIVCFFLLLQYSKG